MAWFKRRPFVSQEASGDAIFANGDAYNHVGAIHHHYGSQEDEVEGELPPNPMEVMARRFLSTYTDHGISVGQIPEFLDRLSGPKVTWRDLRSTESFLDRADVDLLNFTAGLFGIRPDWLRNSDTGYDKGAMRYPRDFDKQPHSFARFLLISSVRRSDGVSTFWPEGRRFTDPIGTLFLVSEHPIEWPKEEGESHAPECSQSVGLIYSTPICDFEDKQIRRHFVLRTVPWDYWRCRFEVAGLLAVADDCRMAIVGRTVGSSEQVHQVCDRGVDVQAALDAPRYHFRYPELSLAWNDNEWERERWPIYHQQFEKWGLARSVREAREERQTLLKKSRSDDDDDY